MPRVKSSGQIEALERQQKELFQKLKVAKAKARAEAKESEDHKAMLTGRLVLGELASNANGALAVAFHAAADKALKRPAERVLFGLPEITAVENKTPVPPSIKDRRAKHEAE